MNAGPNNKFSPAPLRAAVLLALVGAPAAHATLLPGAPRGDAVTVIAGTSAASVNIDTNSRARIAVGPAGNYAVVWSGERDDAGGAVIDSGIYLQRYDSTGKPAGDLQLVQADNATVCADVPAVAMDASGDFVVVWEQLSDCTITFSPRIVMAARLASDGTPGSTYVVATDAAFDPPSVAMDAAGDFVVAWAGYEAPYNMGVRLRYYPVNSTPGPVVPANTITPGSQNRTDVAMDAAGDFVVVWRSSAFPDYPIYARRFNAAGDAVDATEFVVNANTTSLMAMTPSVAMDASGDFIVAWTTQGGGLYAPSAAYVRLYKADSAPAAVAPETFLTPPSPSAAFGNAAAAMDPEGDAVAGAFFSSLYSSSSIMRFVDGATAQPAGPAPALPDCAATTGGTPPVTTTRCAMLADMAMDANGDVLLLSTDTEQSGYYAARYVGLTVRTYQGEKPIDLAASVEVDDSAVETGDPLNYTVKVNNLNPPSSLTGVPGIDNAIGVATGINATLTVPANAEFVSATGAGWHCGAPADGRLTCSQGSLLKAGASSVIDLKFTAPADAGAAVLLAAADGLVYDPELDNNYAAAGTGVAASEDSGNGSDENDDATPGGNVGGGTDGDPARPASSGGGGLGFLGLLVLGLPLARKRRDS